MQKINHTSIRVFTATTTNQQVLSANVNRKSVMIKNVGANTVEFQENNNGIYGQGLPLLTLEILTLEHYEAQDELNVISTVGNSELRILEVISQ